MSDYDWNPAEGTGSQPAEEALDPADALSPAVRRLIKQYELDVSGLSGTGPDGRIRVGDVMALIGGRSAADINAATEQPVPGDARPASEQAIEAQRAPGNDSLTGTARQDEPASTILFECDPGRILTDRKRRRDGRQDVPLAAYFVSAAAAALAGTRTVGPIDADRIPIAIAAAGGIRHAARPASAGEWSVEQIAEMLNRPVHTELPSTPAFVISHHGLAGSLLVQPAQLSANELAVLGIGRTRREVVVRQVNGEEAPRIASRCFVTLSFRASEVDVHAANALLARCVARIEQWPSPG